MSAATYIVGPNDFFTPGDLKNDADTLQAQVTSLASQMESAQLPQNIQDAWALFVQDWSAFYDSEFGGFFTNFLTALNDGNRDQLVQYEQRFASLASAVNGAGLATVGTDVQPNQGTGVLEQIEKQAFGINPDGTPKSPIPGLSVTTVVVVLVLILAAIVAVKVL